MSGGEEESDHQSFELSFEQVECDSCGSVVHVSESCACGDQVPRADARVAERKPVAGELIARLTSPVRPSTAIELGEALGALSGWIGLLFEGLDQLGDAESSRDGIDAAVDQIQDLRERIAATPMYRPYVALWGPIRDTVNALTMLAVRELQACAASTPSLAATAQQDTQPLIDGAANAIAVLSARVDRWDFDPPVGLAASVASGATDAYGKSGAAGVLELEALGAALYEEIAGAGSIPPRGLGAVLFIDLSQADLAFDRDRLIRVARLVYTKLDPDRSRLAKVLDDPEWRADLLHSREVFIDGLAKAVTVVTTLQGERRIEVGAVIELGASLTERVSQHLLNIVLHARAGEKLKRTADWAAVHQAARQQGLGDALLGFDDRIRNAHAHVDFTAGDGFVVLGRNRQREEHLTDDELVDVVLAAVELTAAIFAGLDCILTELGHPSTDDILATIDHETAAKAILAIAGFEVDAASQEGATFVVRGRPMGSVTFRPFSLTAMVATVLPQTVRDVRIEATEPDRRLASASLDALRRWQQADAVDTDFAFVEFGARAVLDGRPMFNRNYIRKYMAVRLGTLMSSGYTQSKGTFEAARATAQRLDDPQLRESVISFVEQLRARERLPIRGRISRTATSRFVDWLNIDPGQPNDGTS